MAGPVGVEELSARTVSALVSVGAEVVTLSLEQVGRNAVAAVAVIVSEGSGESRNRNAVGESSGKHVAPAGLSLFELLAEERVNHEILKGRIVGESLFDLAQEDRTDDASATPHQSDSAIVQIPAVLLGSSTHQSVTLSVRNDLGSEQSLLEVSEERLLVALESRFRTGKNLGSLNPFVFLSRQAASEHSL